MSERIQEISNKARESVPTGLTTEEWIEKYNELFAHMIMEDFARHMEVFKKIVPDHDRSGIDISITVARAMHSQESKIDPSDTNNSVASEDTIS
jgi:hypothetical protein